jgi:hypothetical protein
MKVPHQDIIGNYPPAKKHDDYKVVLKKFPVRQIPAGKGIGREQKQYNAYCGSPRHIEEGIEEPGPEQLVIQNCLVRIQGKINRPEKYPALDNGNRGTEGTGHYIDKGVEYHQAGKQQKNETG